MGVSDFSKSNGNTEDPGLAHEELPGAIMGPEEGNRNEVRDEPRTGDTAISILGAGGDIEIPWRRNACHIGK